MFHQRLVYGGSRHWVHLFDCINEQANRLHSGVANSMANIARDCRLLVCWTVKSAAVIGLTVVRSRSDRLVSAAKDCKHDGQCVFEQNCSSFARSPALDLLSLARPLQSVV